MTTQEIRRKAVAKVETLIRVIKMDTISNCFEVRSLFSKACYLIDVFEDLAIISENEAYRYKQQAKDAFHYNTVKRQ